MTSAIDRLADPIRAVSEAVIDPQVVSADTTINSLVLDGARIDVGILEVITAASIEQDIEGASTLSLTVRDTSRAILRSGVFDPVNRVVSAKLGGLSFVLVQVSKSGDDLTLTFEDEAVNRLRRITTPKVANRATVTRAQFIGGMVAEARPRIPFICPEEAVKQPIAKASSRSSSAKKSKHKDHGFAPKAKVAVRSARATSTQRKVLERVLDVGVSRGAPIPVLEAAVMAVVEASAAKNTTAPDGVGVFRQRKSQGWPASRDIEKDAAAFYTRALSIRRAHPSMTAYELAHTVQRRGTSAGFKKLASEAAHTVSLYKGASLGANRETGGQYLFTRGLPGGEKGEDAWTSGKRLAEEVGWRLFSVAGTIYNISDKRLFAAKPRATFRESDDGVLGIDFDWDAGKSAQECTLTIRAERWGIPPGSVIVLADCGVASGRWLVASASRDLFSQTTDVSLRKPLPTEPEPEAEAADSGSTTGDFSGVPAGIVKAYKRAVAIDKKRGGYAYGGGHGSFSGPYDCSGFVSAVLHAGGYLSKPIDTVSFGRFQKSGTGKYLTIYVKPYTGKNGHVYMVFNMPGKGEERFEAHGPKGARVGKQNRGGDAGYQPRHISGA